MRVHINPLAIVHGSMLCAVALIATTFAVSAEDVVVPASSIGTTVNLGGAYTYLEPFIMAVFTGVVGLFLSVIAAYVKKKTGLDIQQQQLDQLNMAASNAAGRILASQESRFAHAAIDVHSPLIARELPKVGAYAGDAIQALGYTPDHVADIVLAHVGKLQAQSTAGTVLDASAVKSA